MIKQSNKKTTKAPPAVVSSSPSPPSSSFVGPGWYVMIKILVLNDKLNTTTILFTILYQRVTPQSLPPYQNFSQKKVPSIGLKHLFCPNGVTGQGVTPTPRFGPKLKIVFNRLPKSNTLSSLSTHLMWQMWQTWYQRLFTIETCILSWWRNWTPSPLSRLLWPSSENLTTCFHSPLPSPFWKLQSTTSTN